MLPDPVLECFRLGTYQRIRKIRATIHTRFLKYTIVLLEIKLNPNHKGRKMKAMSSLS